MRMPGWANIWTQPIINRIDMLATGVRTDDRREGLRQQSGPDPGGVRTGGRRASGRFRGAVDVFPDQSRGKGYLEIKIDRDEAARYGVNVGDVQDVIETALGGKAITMTVEGRERFPVRIRYARAFARGRRGREEPAGQRGRRMAAWRTAAAAEMAPASPGRSPASQAAACKIPLAMVADVKIVEGPGVIKSENGMLRSYVQLNVRDRDMVGFVEEAQRAVAQKVKLPAGHVPRVERPVREPGPRRQDHASRVPGGRCW